MAKDKLSHTTLERKIRLIFGLLILLVVVIAFFFPTYVTEKQLLEQDAISAREMVRWGFLRLHASAAAGEMQDSESIIEDLTRLGPPSSRANAEMRIVSTLDKTERLPGNDMEQRWLTMFQENPERSPDKSAHFTDDDGYMFRYAYALRARESCLDCHRTSHPELAANDLMGAIVVTFPTDDTRWKITVNRIILGATAIGTAMLSMMIFYWVVRWVIVQPVTHLKHTAERVTQGDLHVRSDIKTGDEFEGLSRSFNRMLERLENSREELRRANLSLDHKLEELAKANVSLFEMNQVKSKFLTTMSHELRTPLNSIIGFADILEGNSRLREDAKLSRYVSNIRNSGRMLLELVNDLLDLAKIEAGKMDLKLGQVSPLDLCETTMNMVRPLVGRKDLRLELEVDPQSPIMTTDANKLQQILYNLLSNAVKFTPSGLVRLTARQIDGETMIFQVTDTGPGLSAEQQGIIFDRFTQVDAGHTRQHGGTGLGLSIVRELVNLLGGEVAVQSEAGHGATFNVTLPIESGMPTPPVPAPITMVEPRPQPRTEAGELAPEPVTPEDTVIGHDLTADQLQPEQTDDSDGGSAS